MPYRVNFPNKIPLSDVRLYLSAGILSAMLWMISYQYGQHDFYGFFPLYTLAFGAWLVLIRSELNTRHIFGIGIVLRVGLICSMPALSDDLYRFFWDGRLTLSGISPYGILPEEALKASLPYLDQNLFDKLNSPAYYTIYPPVSQCYYAIAAATGNITMFAIVLKSMFLITEISGLIYLMRWLKHGNMPANLSSVYFLNPLVITEGIGNLHFEVIMLSFLIIALYHILNNKRIKGAAWMALSIGIKLLPLMILPYFWFKFAGKVRWQFFGCLLLFLLFVFFPMFGSIPFSTFMSSVDLYFRKFEFNAGVYYLFRFLGEHITGYNMIRYIGPALGMVTIGYNVYLAKKAGQSEKLNFATYALYVWTAYLLLATTVHPWYVISLVFFGALAVRQYPNIWAYLVWISYVNYSQEPYFENLYFITAEYVLLFGFMWWEFGRIKSKSVCITSIS